MRRVKKGRIALLFYDALKTEKPLKSRFGDCCNADFKLFKARNNFFEEIRQFQKYKFSSVGVM